jgi:hypothetical protein
VPKATPGLLLSVVLAVSACDDYHLDGPVDPEPLNPPRLVSVTVEYLQPNGCVEGSPRCDDPVVFFASWMETGTEFLLRKEPGRFVWRGTATGVPVNFPPRGPAHAVRVYDPHLVGTMTEGVTAERLKIGGEAISVRDNPGGIREVGLVYIDENGQGRNPY